MFIIIPTNVHVSTIKSILKLLRSCLGVPTPFSGSLQVVLAKVMNY